MSSCLGVGRLVVDLDAHVAEGRDDGLDLLGVDQVVGQVVVDLRIGEEAALLAELDQVLQARAAGLGVLRTRFGAQEQRALRVAVAARPAARLAQLHELLRLHLQLHASALFPSASAAPPPLSPSLFLGRPIPSLWPFPARLVPLPSLFLWRRGHARAISLFADAHARARARRARVPCAFLSPCARAPCPSMCARARLPFSLRACCLSRSRCTLSCSRSFCARSFAAAFSRCALCLSISRARGVFRPILPLARPAGRAFALDLSLCFDIMFP